MMGHTHQLIGSASWLGGLAIATASGMPHVTAGVAFVGWVAASLAALVPDLDSKRSTASQMFGWTTEALSWVIRTVGGGHRKITHSLLGMSLALGGCLSAQSACHLPPWLSAAMSIGYVSHILSDMLTKEGCPLLWPLSEHKFGIHLVTTGLGKVKGHYTSEHWLITPVFTVISIFSVMALLVGY